MKNYSLNKEAAKDFILNYKINNEQIIINYANGNIEKLPYSIKNEKQILEKMRYQILNSNNFFTTLNNKFEISVKLLIDEVTLMMLYIITIFNFKVPLMTNIIGSIFLPVAIGVTTYKLVGYQKIKKDIKKQLLFLNNEGNINSTIRNRPQIIKELDVNLKKKVLASNNSDLIFTLNTIDKMEYKELQQVYYYVKQEEDILNKPKTLSKKKK